MKWLLIVVFAVLAGILVLTVFEPQHQKYLAFDVKRQDWHRRCDRYVGTPDNQLDAHGKACAQELQELTAYAKQQGW